MIFKPSNIAELTQALARATQQKQKIGGVDLTALNRVLEHTAEDMTVTIEACITLSALQTALAKHGQWLPLDPPHADRITIREAIDSGASGPRRFGLGTIRDYLIGVKMAMPDGTTVCSGGKVVKNVAGDDLARLFIGGQGTLGIPVEATFKLRPLPELEKFVRASFATLAAADKLIEAVIESPLTPIVLDLHGTGESATVVTGFAGTREEVEWQLEKAAALGLTDAGSLDYDQDFWADAAPANRWSVLPSKLVAAVRQLNGEKYIARAGNGVIYHRGPMLAPQEELPMELMRRVKDAYDPAHILPELPL